MNKIVECYLSVNWKTRLISIMILVVSIIMSTITFLLLIHIQVELTNVNIHFFRDFSTLVAYYVADLMQKGTEIELKSLVEKIYLASANINYLQLFDSHGCLLLSLPTESLFYEPVFDSFMDIQDLTDYISFLHISIFSNLIFLSNNATNCMIPIVVEQKLLGFLHISLSFNDNVIYIDRLVQYASSFIFVFVWLIFILGAFLNFFIIIDPISEVLVGMQNISLGNFEQNIDISAKGSLANLIISFNEMSERLQYYEKNHVTQLTSEKAKLESLVSTIADGAILLDTELRILLVNQIAVKVFHWSNKDLIGSIIFQHLPIHVNEALLPVLNGMVKSNCFDDKNIQSQELIINLNDESLKTFRFLLSTISNYNHYSFNGAVVIIQDITRENQLNEAKNQFISNVSHELRTPLCNIGSFLETLIDYNHKLTVQQKDQFLDIAYVETKRLNSLVNDILDLSRLESECNYILKPIILTNTISYIVQASQIIALNKKIQILIEIHPRIEKIFAHQSALCQVLSNLISNSLKFTHKEGRIVVRVYPLLVKKYEMNSSNIALDIVRLEIIDEGIGIHKIFQRQIFDRFMRIENNIHILKGTGLGLSIVKNIIKKHNSIISVYSEVDIGTSFWFDLSISI